MLENVIDSDFASPRTSDHIGVHLIAASRRVLILFSHQITNEIELKL